MNTKRIKFIVIALAATTMTICAGLLIHRIGSEAVRRYNFSRLPRTYDAFLADQLARRNRSREPDEPLQTLNDLERLRKIMTAVVFANHLFETDPRLLEPDTRARDLEMLRRMVLPPAHEALDEQLAREDQVRPRWIGVEMDPSQPAQIDQQDSNTVHLAYKLVKQVGARESRWRNITVDVELVHCPDAQSQSAADYLDFYRCMMFGFQVKGFRISESEGGEIMNDGPAQTTEPKSHELRATT